MKKMMLFVLALCLCFTVFGGSAFAETAQAETTGTETVAAEKPAAEMTAEELYETGKAAMDAGDYAKALEYCQLAAEQGSASAQYNIGYSYRYGEGVEQDYAKALEYYTLAAEQGFPAAIFCVGDCYYLGLGAEKDLDKAAEWYQKALDAGYEPDEEDQKHLDDVQGKQK